MHFLIEAAQPSHISKCAVCQFYEDQILAQTRAPPWKRREDVDVKTLRRVHCVCSRLSVDRAKGVLKLLARSYQDGETRLATQQHLCASSLADLKARAGFGENQPPGGAVRIE